MFCIPLYKISFFRAVSRATLTLSAITKRATALFMLHPRFRQPHVFRSLLFCLRATPTGHAVKLLPFNHVWAGRGQFDEVTARCWYAATALTGLDLPLVVQRGSTLVFTSPVGTSRGRGVLMETFSSQLGSDLALRSGSTLSRYNTSALWQRANVLYLTAASTRRRQSMQTRGRLQAKFLARTTLGVRSFQQVKARRALWRLRSRRTKPRFYFFRKIRRPVRGFHNVFPSAIARRYRFVRKFRALFTVRAQHTNLFFTIRQGSTYFSASTGMFEDLKHGTKRKRTLLAGWFLADRLFDRAQYDLKEKTIFRVDLYGRTSGRRGVWFSWRTKPWRLFIIRSRTPIAYNGTRGCRRRRL